MTTIDHTLPVCEISVDVFTLAAPTPFDLTLEIYTDRSTSGAARAATHSSHSQPRTRAAPSRGPAE